MVQAPPPDPGAAGFPLFTAGPPVRRGEVSVEPPFLPSKATSGSAPAGSWSPVVRVTWQPLVVPKRLYPCESTPPPPTPTLPLQSGSSPPVSRLPATIVFLRFRVTNGAWSMPPPSPLPLPSASAVLRLIVAFWRLMVLATPVWLDRPPPQPVAWLPVRVLLVRSKGPGLAK